MKKTILKKTPLGILISLIPYVMGVTGYLNSGYRVQDALYSSITLYSMKAPSPTPNIQIEVARWFAFIITASWVVVLVSSLRNGLRNFITYHLGNSIAVYGPEAERTAMLKKLKKHGIDGKDKFVRAHRYLLLGTEEENFRFYEQNRKALDKKAVYLKSDSLPIQSVSDSELRLFAPEETAARQYWKERCLYAVSAAHEHKIKVVFLGFGRLGEELLTFGLQDNIFSPDQRIEYHIFGDGEAFCATHTQLSEISDPVFFYSEPWYQKMPLIEEAHRVIVLTQKDQLALLRELLLSTDRQEIDVFSVGLGIDLLSDRERLKPYPWLNNIKNPEFILSEKLYERAKKLNLRYAVLYGGAEDTDAAMEEEWHKLDTFTRYSNISAADFHEICLMMLKERGETAERCMDLLSELEHIRWCRYHYLNNWKYGVPENGKNKDTKRRIHVDLRPYHELSQEERGKDTESVKVLLSVK